MHGDLKRNHNRAGSKIIYFLFVIILLPLSCRDKSPAGPAARLGKEDMADLNKYLVQKDRERIKNYIERKGLKMTETSTGLWYQILEEGSGPTFRDNDKVVMKYDCSLLDGTKCYSSDELGPKQLILGKSSMEAGIGEGLKLLKPGAKAVFIIPPFLAYGFVGDRKMIPPRAVIVYNVNILRRE